jgi:MoxR-like ATPase
LAARIVTDATALSRMTRSHADVRQGSSVRGAIDLFFLTESLCAIRGVEEPDDERYQAVVFDAMLVALTGRLLLDESTDATPAGVLREIWESYFILDPAAAQPG